MIKVLTQEQIIPAGSAAAVYEKRLELGSETKKVLGYYLLILQTGGLTPEQCKLTYANSSRTIFEPTGLGHLIVNAAVAIKDRFFREEPFDVDGFIQSKITIPAPLGGTAFVLQHLLLVETSK
jgi:hypothetical protein